MEAPWVILGRVIRGVPVVPNNVEAEAAHAAAVEDAQAEDIGAVDADAEAQEEHVEAADGAEVQHQAEDAAAEPDITVSIALPRRVAILAAGREAHPIPDDRDVYPYIIATDPVCLLAHFAAAPFYGVFLGFHPHSSHLVLVRGFHTAAGGQTTASAEHIVDRPGRIPPLQHILNLILDSNYTGGGGGAYRIADLIIQAGVEHATYVRFYSALGQWFQSDVRYPLAAAYRQWIPGGALLVDRTYCWFDLSWGILSLDADIAIRKQEGLLFHNLPADRALDESTPDIDTRRCITLSRGRLRYVEIIVTEGEPARVFMWTWRRGQAGWRWDLRYMMTFEQIWNDNSYTETELPRNVPVLAAVCPSDPKLVYFALEQQLFGVNVPQHRVVHVEDYELVSMSGLPQVASGRSVVAWNLPPGVVQALHH